MLSLDKAFAKLGDKESKAQHKIVRQAERLYLKAAEAAGNNAIQKMILSQVPELEEEKKVQMDFGVTQEDINQYVDNAYSKQNTEDYIPLYECKRTTDKGCIG